MLAFAPEDRPLIECIFLKYETVLRKYVFNCLQDEELVKEVIQDSVVTFMNKFDSLTVLSEEQLYTYLYSIVRSKTQKQLVRMSRDISLTELEEMDFTLDAEEIVLGKLNAAELFDKIHNLPSQYGEYLLLAYIHKIAPEEIARILDVKQSSLRMIAHRAKSALSKLLREEKGVH